MRKLATWGFAFAAGVFLAQYLLPWQWQLPATACALALGFLALALREPERLRAVLICTALTAGLGYNWLYMLWVQLPAERLADTEQSQVAMTLCEYPSATDYGAKATVLLRLEGLHAVRAVYYGGEALLGLEPGDVITDGVRLKSAARIRDDQVTTFTSRGVFLFAYGGEGMTAETGGAFSPRWWPVRLGNALRAKAEALFPGENAGFVKAILTGDTGGVGNRSGRDLSEAGIYHIMAVSGMHCSILLGLVTVFTGGNRPRRTAAAAIPLLVFYALLTGARPSVIRACFMLGLPLLAPLARREGDSPTAMAAALALILLQNPFAAASIGLQLSFGAVAGILWLTPKLDRFLQRGKARSGLFRFFSAGFSATCGALVFTQPLTAYYFGSLVLISPLSNLLCLPAVSLIFGGSLLALLLGFLWMPAAAVLALIPRALIAYVLTAVRCLAGIPYHALYFTNPFLKYWLVYFYVLFGAAYLVKPKARRKFALAAILAAASLAVTVKLGELYYSYGALDVVAVDVGQGESVVMASGGQFALMDCGSGNSWMDPGNSAAEQLLTMGCSSLDYLVLSHYDYDHVSGVSDLMDRLEVKTLLAPDYQDDANLRDNVMAAAGEHGAAVEFVTSRRTYSLGGSVMTVFPPLGADNDNDRGLTLLCSAGDFDLLITGDMDGATEKKLVETYRLPDIEVLVAGHHGSRYSTSEELLEAVRPETALISVGSNSYGHPTEETLRRLAGAGVQIYRTDKQGSIHISVN